VKRVAAEQGNITLGSALKKAAPTTHPSPKGDNKNSATDRV